MSVPTLNERGLIVTGQLLADIEEAGTIFLYLATMSTEPAQKKRWRQSAERWRYRKKRIKAAYESARPLEQGEVGTVRGDGRNLASDCLKQES